MKGVCKKIIERSVELNIEIDKIKVKNMNISLRRENTNVLIAAFTV